MNERSRELIGYVDVNAKIRELADQAGCSIDKLGYGEGNLEKFAELIVRECADIARHNVMNISTYSDAEFVSDLITQYFGVKS